MALRRTLAKRLFNRNIDSPAPSIIQNASKMNFQREFVTSLNSAYKGFFRRFLHRKSVNQSARLPEFLSIPVGDKLREKLWQVNIAGERIRLDGLSPPVPSPAENIAGISVQDARKILWSSQLEKLRSTLRQIPMNSIAYSEFVRICSDVCKDREQGLNCAKMLDEAGNVIVLGKMVFLRPDQVAESMEKLIYESIATPNDPRKGELEQMEKQRALIDRKAESLVRGELYCGLGLMVLQTLGFMRLTWELGWDVMEPICFFVTSLHLALAYSFFLRTSREPTFQGFFQRRFEVKQEKLIKAHNFDVEKYTELCKAFYPNYVIDGEKFGHFRASVGRAMPGPVDTSGARKYILGGEENTFLR